MAKAAKRAGATLPHGALPDEIIVWEILLRLPPKPLLRCRAVCRAWRSATSTQDFLLAHHACQPTLPLIDTCCNSAMGVNDSLDIICFDNRPGVEQLQPLARLTAQSSFHMDPAFSNGDNISFFHPVASCDGILIFCVEEIHYFICNPATRQYARLPLSPNVNFRWWSVLGMYPHLPSGEYRLLLCSYKHYSYDEPEPDSRYACHVLALGSGQPPRQIGWPHALMLELELPYVLCCGNLHCYPTDDDDKNEMIVVFDTTSESFREMRPPVVTYCGDLFEMDGMLGIAVFDSVKTVDIWVLQDYKREVWALNHRIDMPLGEIEAQCDKHDKYAWWSFKVVIVPGEGDGELFVLIKFAEWLARVGMDGKLVATFHHKEFSPTYLQLKQTLFPHNFFPTLEGYAVNAPPFI